MQDKNLPPEFQMKSYNVRSAGSALVITLGFLVLITVLVLGLMDTVRTEKVSANSNLGAVQADFFAQAAVDRVVGTLQQQLGTNAITNWTSQPGQLIISDSNSNGVPTQKVLLSSGSADSTLIDPAYNGPACLVPPDLNIPTFRDNSTHLITEDTDAASGKILQMPVAWIYVRKSGQLVFDSKPPTNKSDPIVGRYAYWTDDESSKINYNLAWGRTSNNTAPMGDPSKIDLTALPPFNGNSAAPFTQANELHTFISQSVNGAAAHGFYNTPKDARQVPDANLASALETCKFELTHYNNDPDTTFFNKQRIVLTTQKSKVRMGPDGNLPPFIDILKTPDTDPGIWSVTGGNIDASKLSDAINLIVSYLKRTDWPMAQGASFQEKYYEGDPDRLAQLAINIIEYVRCKESSELVVNPLRVKQTNGTYAFASVATDNTYFGGLSRLPLITELGVFISGSTVVSSGTAGWPITLKMEVFLPPGYGLDQVTLTDFTVGFQPIYNNHYFSPPSGRILFSEITGAPGGVLKAGGYAVITRLYNSASSFIPTSATPVSGQRPSGNIKVRTSISAQYGAYVNQANAGGEIVPLIYGANDCIPLTIDPPNVPLESITSCEVDDPRVNKSVKDWLHSQIGGTFGRQNTIYCSPPVSSPSDPQQDTCLDGTVSDYSMHMPPPKGKTFNGEDNSDGLVHSVGELGYINTGMKGSIAGIPWRSLRLQPNSDAFGTVPDWALMDLFTVPIAAPPATKPIFQPNGTSYGGRVNVNSHVQPFNLQRILPLAAVFQSAPYTSNSSSSPALTLSSGSAQAIAQNIFNRVVSQGGNKGKLYGFENGYYSPGEIVEIQGVADRGEESEELVRQVSNLLTTRGNVFTIYSVGQSIKQTPSGNLKMKGERRIQSMVERYLFDGTTGEIRFRTIYYKSLTP